MSNMSEVEKFPYRLRFLTSKGLVLAEGMFRTRENAEVPHKMFVNRTHPPGMFLLEDDMGQSIAFRTDKIAVGVLFHFPTMHAYNALANTQITVEAERLEQAERRRLDATQKTGFHHGS